MREISLLQSGQRVKLLPFEICYRMDTSEIIGINEYMEHYFGGYVTISRKRKDGCFHIVEDNCNWVWTSAWIDVNASFQDLFVNKKQEV